MAGFFWMLNLFRRNKAKQVENRGYPNYEKVFGDLADVARKKSNEEVNLIADFEMEYGEEFKWSDEVQAAFDAKWEEIQNKYPEKLRNAT